MIHASVDSGDDPQIELTYRATVEYGMEDLLPASFMDLTFRCEKKINGSLPLPCLQQKRKHALQGFRSLSMLRMFKFVPPFTVTAAPPPSPLIPPSFSSCSSPSSSSSCPPSSSPSSSSYYYYYYYYCCCCCFYYYCYCSFFRCM